MSTSGSSTTTKLKQKYLENVLKDTLFMSPEKPQLRTIEDRKTFWEAVDMVITSVCIPDPGIKKVGYPGIPDITQPS